MIRYSDCLLWYKTGRYTEMSERVMVHLVYVYFLTLKVYTVRQFLYLRCVHRKTGILTSVSYKKEKKTSI